jgi:hypothetical protein
MTALLVRPVRFTDRLAEMERFLRLLGLRPLIVSEGGSWNDMVCGAGRVALHDAATSDTGGLPGLTSLGFEADDVLALSRQLTVAGVPGVTVYDEAYGRVLSCTDPEDSQVIVDERHDDLYGFQLHAEPGVEPTLRVSPVRFTDPAGAYGTFLEALGLRRVGELNPNYVTFESDGGRQGQVGLHRVFGDDLPIVGVTSHGAVQLCFETGEPLEQVAGRLTAAGFEPAIRTEDFGQVLTVTDPDDQLVEVTRS